jgi:anaerobic selenocysteine-containing dehydrogenase
MQNFVFSVPNTDKNLQALNNLDLIVSVDTHLSETALMADYVIPGSVFLERTELLGQWVTFPVVTLRQQVVPPLFGQNWSEFIQDLARNSDTVYPFTAYERISATRSRHWHQPPARERFPAPPDQRQTHYRKHETSGLPPSKGEFSCRCR